MNMAEGLYPELQPRIKIEMKISDSKIRPVYK
jgi:hypothetical protein